MELTGLLRALNSLSSAALLLFIAAVLAGHARADAANLPPPPLPVFTPTPNDWSPNFEIWPYNTFTYRVTPEMISGMSETCQWFRAQSGELMGQIIDFNHDLGDVHDDYSVGGAQLQADTVIANIDKSTAFLRPRVGPLMITNTPDNFGPYSPIYGGESITNLTLQLTRISESMKKKDPSGVTHAYIVAATGWAAALRDSGACT